MVNYSLHLDERDDWTQDIDRSIITSLDVLEIKQKGRFLFIFPDVKM